MVTSHCCCVTSPTRNVQSSVGVALLLQMMEFAFSVASMDVKESLLWNKPRVHRRLSYICRGIGGCFGADVYGLKRPSPNVKEVVRQVLRTGLPIF